MSARILVVDDEPAVRLMIRKILAVEGYDVEDAANGMEALQTFERRIPDVVLLDLMMPEMDGWHFLEELRARDLRNSTRVIIVSALRDDETLQRSRDSGAPHLLKPFDPQALIDAIEDALRETPDGLVGRKERVGELAVLLHTLQDVQEGR